MALRAVIEIAEVIKTLVLWTPDCVDIYESGAGIFVRSFRDGTPLPVLTVHVLEDRITFDREDTGGAMQSIIDLLYYVDSIRLLSLQSTFRYHICLTTLSLTVQWVFIGRKIFLTTRQVRDFTLYIQYWITARESDEIGYREEYYIEAILSKEMLEDEELREQEIQGKLFDEIRRVVGSDNPSILPNDLPANYRRLMAEIPPSES